MNSIFIFLIVNSLNNSSCKLANERAEFCPRKKRKKKKKEEAAGARLGQSGLVGKSRAAHAPRPEQRRLQWFEVFGRSVVGFGRIWSVNLHIFSPERDDFNWKNTLISQRHHRTSVENVRGPIEEAQEEFSGPLFFAFLPFH